MNQSPNRGVRKSLNDDGVPPAVSIVRTVADVAGVNVSELEPLEESVPADALNSVARSDGTQLYFEYEGYDVTLDGGDAFIVSESDATSVR